MARRKVTMLEAFQRSARESAERVAAERRRVIVEREKEIRRAETARAAQEFGSRLSQRAGDSMGSLLAGIRGVTESTDAVAAEDSAPAAGASDIHQVPAAAAPEPSPEPGPERGPERGVVRSGPALPAFDRAVQPDLPDAASFAAEAARKSDQAPADKTGHEPAEESAIEHADTAPESAEARLPEEDLDQNDSAEEESDLESASQEDVEEAIAALEGEVFELPISARAFTLFSLSAALAIFMIGYSLGSRSQSAMEPASDSGSAGGFVRAGYGDAQEARAQPLPPLAGRGPAGQLSPSSLPQEASPDAGLSDAVSSAIAPAEGPPALTPEDEIFRDRNMKFTILTITYSRTEAHAKLAMETYDYLYAEGFPVIHPIEKDSRLFLFVGAAASQGELESLQQELKELRTNQNRKTRPFRDAYLVNIDPYR